MTVNTREAQQVCRGTVWQVDPARGDVVVQSDDQLRVFEVPADCTVLLSGERVKLRFLQPRDHVEVAYTQRGGRAVASLVRVDWLSLLQDYLADEGPP